MDTNRVITTDYFYLDPAEHPPPTGVKMILLTSTGTAVIGQWGDKGYRGWYPLPKIPAHLKPKRD